MRNMMLNKRLGLFFAIACLCISAMILAKDNDQQSAQKNNLKYEKVECSFDILPKYFNSYHKFYPELFHTHSVFDWSALDGKHRCEDVLDFIMKHVKRRWKIEIDPITPEDGIQKGILIIYGHYIEPPYKFVIDKNRGTLHVNNIPLQPALSPGYFPQTEYDKRFERAGEIDDELKILFTELKESTKKDFDDYLSFLIDKHGKDKGLVIFEKYLKRVSGERGVLRDFKIYDREKLLYDFRLKCRSDWDIPLKYYYSEEEWKEEVARYPQMAMTKEKRLRFRKEEDIKSSNEWINKVLGFFEKNLKENKIIVFTTFQQREIISHDDLSSIIKILRSENLDGFSKLNLTNAYIKDDTQIIELEMIYNYEQSNIEKLKNRILATGK